MLVTLGWLGLLLRIYHEASSVGRLAVPRKERDAMKRAHGAHHGGRHGRTRVPGARCRARAARARFRTRVARHAARAGSATGAAASHSDGMDLRERGSRQRCRDVACWRRSRLARAVWQSLQVMRRRQSGRRARSAADSCRVPAVSRRGCRDRPLVIHEQNAIAGMTNRMLAHLASRVLEALSVEFSARRAGRARRQSCATRDRHARIARAARSPNEAGHCACSSLAAARVPRA